ncbi:MAG: hypothetical protein P8179_24420, partial [Candidatus Thiodiazotropha sp.]
DTLTIEPDEQRFTVVWRAHITLRQSIHEMDMLIVGKPSPGWEHARMVDKPYVAMTDLNAFGRQYEQMRLEQERSEQTGESDEFGG